jgi:hypothetical protein
MPGRDYNSTAIEVFSQYQAHNHNNNRNPGLKTHTWNQFIANINNHYNYTKTIQNPSTKKKNLNCDKKSNKTKNPKTLTGRIEIEERIDYLKNHDDVRTESEMASMRDSGFEIGEDLIEWTLILSDKRIQWTRFFEA